MYIAYYVLMTTCVKPLYVYCILSDYGVIKYLFETVASLRKDSDKRYSSISHGSCSFRYVSSPVGLVIYVLHIIVTCYYHFTVVLPN